MGQRWPSEYEVSGWRKSCPGILSWSRVFLGRCNLLFWWWRWQRSVPPSRTDPVVSPGPAQTGNLHHRGKTLIEIHRKHKKDQKATYKCIKWKHRKILPPTKASPAPLVSTMSLGSIFSTGNVSTLSPEQAREEKIYVYSIHLTKDKILSEIKRNIKKEKDKK